MKNSTIVMLFVIGFFSQESLNCHISSGLCSDDNFEKLIDSVSQARENKALGDRLTRMEATEGVDRRDLAIKRDLQAKKNLEQVKSTGSKKNIDEVRGLEVN